MTAYAHIQIREKKYIFLYGGNNIKWIREFLCKVREIASKTQMNFEFAYIGKNKMVRETIAKERMSHCALLNTKGVWWFWARLQSMFLSRIQYLEMANHFVKEYSKDEILQGLKKLLSYEGKNATIEGWVLLSKGSEVVVCGHGSKMLQAMNDYEIWKENIAATKSFGQAFKDYHEMLSKDKHSCCTLEYPITLSKIPENERCLECSRRKNATIEGWVLLSKGSEVVVCGHGSKMLQAMNDYEIWKENITATKSFGHAFKDHHEMLSKDKHYCCTLEYPITLSKIPENERCPECSRPMQTFLTFTCCHDHYVDYDSDE
nr:protein SIEVE ELEMENT OCCLUSION B-like [Ipomoea trifida]